jgi:uncharacterized protein YozE (UPF0346 family)
MTRFYLHGDASESKPGKYYCAFCDLSEPREHFFSDIHKSDHHERLALTKRTFAGLKKRHPEKYSRPNQADNIVSEIPKPKLSLFTPWLKRQKERDDPVGDLAGDAIADRKFPVSANQLPALKNYLFSRGADSEALQALEEAWSEFSDQKKPRSGMSLKLRFEVFRANDYRCQLCGATAQDGVKLEIDHKTPVAKGGTDDLDNLWTLCFPCNRGKGTGDL